MTDFSELPPQFEFHHLGYATRGIDRERRVFENLGYRIEGETFVDPAQGVTGCFLVGAGPRIELLENSPGEETLTAWLNAGVKVYHFAYRVPDIEAAIDWARSKRGKVTVSPVAAVAFGGAKICFVMFPNGFLIEFIEDPDIQS